MTTTKKDRLSIPDDLANRLLAEARFRCCICPEHRREVQIHHINGNPADNVYDNLVVVCANCHADIHTRGMLYRNLNAHALTTMKEKWVEICKSYESHIISLTSNIQNFFFFNVSWTQRILSELTGESLFESPIFALGAEKLYLFPSATSLAYKEALSVLVYLEYAIQKIASKSNPLLLEDVLQYHFRNVPLTSSFVVFTNDFYGKGLPKSTLDVDEKYNVPAKIYRKFVLEGRTYTVEMFFDPRFLASTTSFLHMSGHNILSGIGMLLGCTEDKGNYVLKIRPLAIGSYGPKLGEFWFDNSETYDKFKRYKKDMLAFINDLK